MPKTVIDPLMSPLHGGFAGIELPVDQFDFGEGIVMRRTFVHIMAPYMAAFAPASRGEPHPAPWRAVAGGFGFDIFAELFVPLEFQPPKWFDRLNTVWWFAALIVPDGCALQVGSEVRRWHEGKCLVFDDTVEHSAWNNSTESRIVLLVDFVRPGATFEASEPARAAIEVITGQSARELGKPPV
jgi:hypothetical protein